MADLDLRNVQNIANSEAFNSDVSVLLSQAGRFRDIAAATLRQLLSTSLIQSGAADPGESDKIVNTTVFYIQTTDETLHVSLAGGNWIALGGGATDTVLTDEQLQDKIDAFLVAGSNITLTYDDAAGTLTIAATGTGGGLTAEQVRDTIAAFLVGGTNVTVTHDDTNNTLTIAATDTNTQLTDEQLQDKVAAFLTAGSNISLNYNDETGRLTIAATGTGGPQESGEIGRILSIGSYTLGTSGAPATGNAGYTGGKLYVHVNAASGDKSAILGGLAEGDYIHIGTDAILEITAAPTSAASVYTFTVTVLDGEVPASGSHTLSYIKENRAIIAGAIRGFNLANGAVALANLAAEVLTNWLSAVASDNTLQGDGTPDSQIGIAPGGVGADEIAAGTFDIGKATLLGVWERRGNAAFDGYFHFVDLTPREIRINKTDDDGSDKQSELLALRADDSINVQGLGLFILSATPTISGDQVTLVGSWLGSSSSPSTQSGNRYKLYHIKRHNRIGSTVPQPGTILEVGDDYNLIYAPKTSQGGGGDEFFSSQDDSQIGEFSNFGGWAVTTTDPPTTGQAHFAATTVKMFDTTSGGENKDTDFEALVSGDRLQFGDVNVFQLTATPTQASNVWTLNGVWGDVFDATDFTGTLTVRKILKKNVIIHNTAIPGRLVKVSESRQIITNDPDDNLDTLWSGEASPGASHERALNAGKKFSDYSHIIVEFKGAGTRRASRMVPRLTWVSRQYEEVFNSAHRADVRWRSDTSWSVSAGNTSMVIYKIYGYKGV